MAILLASSPGPNPSIRTPEIAMLPFTSSSCAGVEVPMPTRLVTVKSLPIVTSFGKPTVTAPVLALTSTSLAVPVRLVTPVMLTALV